MKIIFQSVFNCHGTRTPDHISAPLKMDRSKKYFSHYFQEMQTTKNKFRDSLYISTSSEEESERFIEMCDLRQEVKEEDTAAEVDKKTATIRRIREMSRTLDDLSNKMADVKKETIRLKQENEVIDEYIQNLMEQTKTFGASQLK